MRVVPEPAIKFNTLLLDDTFVPPTRYSCPLFQNRATLSISFCILSSPLIAFLSSLLSPLSFSSLVTISSGVSGLPSLPFFQSFQSLPSEPSSQFNQFVPFLPAGQIGHCSPVSHCIHCSQVSHFSHWSPFSPCSHLSPVSPLSHFSPFISSRKFIILSVDDADFSSSGFNSLTAETSSLWFSSSCIILSSIERSRSLLLESRAIDWRSRLDSWRISVISEFWTIKLSIQVSRGCCISGFVGSSRGGICFLIYYRYNVYYATIFTHNFSFLFSSYFLADFFGSLFRHLLCEGDLDLFEDSRIGLNHCVSL